METLSPPPPIKTIDCTSKLDVQYCIPLWLRDEQIKHNVANVAGRIAPVYDLRSDPIAVVCFGPSLNQTWQLIEDFKFIITCSGAHKFLIDHGIIPTWHSDVDPREHKIKLLGTPHKDVEYLMASTVHPKMFEHLAGMNVKLWHVFANDQEADRILPRGEWALFGGSSAGLRALTIARFLGFTDLHIFGMDGSEGPTGKHAAEHPNQAKGHCTTEYNGVTYKTTNAIAECARQTFHELNQMPDVKATFYGEGLVQAMAKDYKPSPVAKGTPTVGMSKPELISTEMIDLNAKLHKDNVLYGVGGAKHADTVLKLAESIKSNSILDYGCGKGLLAKEIPFPIWEYDPAIPGKTQLPRPADLVVCTDVLEHVEPDKLQYVLEDLQRCVKKIGYFVIATGAAGKTYADGRNTHLLQHGEEWWQKRLSKFFTIGKIQIAQKQLHVIVAPKEVATAQTMSIETVENDGVTCRFHTPNETTQWRARTILKKEPVTTAWINSMKSGETFFDVGANVGGYSVLAGKRGLKVYAFEPASENYALLVRNLNLNELEPNAFCLALTDRDEFGMLRLSSSDAGGSCHSFGKSKGIGVETSGNRQGCYGVPLDILIERGLPSPDHIKIDVDGFEHCVVAGADKTLRNGVKSVLVEVNTKSRDHLDMVNNLEKMGFTFDQKQVDESIRKEGAFEGVSEYLFRKVDTESPLTENAFLSERLCEVFGCVALLKKEPFPWLYVEDVWPNYEEMIANLPEKYDEISKSRAVKGYPQRFTAKPQTPFWTDLFGRMQSGAFKRQLCKMFDVPNPDDYDDECLLIRDFAGYHIGPHTDSPAKVITVLFYLPKDDSLLGAGTSIYEPIESGFTCAGGPHYPSDKFRILKTMEYRPNTAFAFLKTNNSFHGVEPCTGTRDVLLYDVRRR